MLKSPYIKCCCIAVVVTVSLPAVIRKGCKSRGADLFFVMAFSLNYNMKRKNRQPSYENRHKSRQPLLKNSRQPLLKNS